MSTTSQLGLATAAVLALGGVTAFTLHHMPESVAARSAFSGMIRGAVTALPDGGARFGMVSRQAGSPAAFSLTLGVGDREGSVLISAPVEGELRPGSYPIRDDAETGTVRALVVTGPAERPTGTFRARRGTLTLTQVSDSTMSGRFELTATGFLTENPADETRSVTASGSFAAVR